MIRVRLIGELRVEVDGSPVTTPAAWHARELLAWLALHPGEHRRAALAPRFWPDVLDESARASLRTALWALRRALGPSGQGALVTTRDAVALEAWVDVRELTELTAAGRDEEALGLADGLELLRDLDDDWVLAARDEHVATLDALLGRLAHDAEAAGDLIRATELAGRRAALDPLAESPARELVRLRAAAGDRAGALRAYDRLRERLAAELRIAPSGETRALAEHIRAAGDETEAPPARWRPSFPARLETPAPGPLVGRAGAVAKLAEAWQRSAAGGRPGLVLVSGEPGVGKTRLAAELACDVYAAGGTVLYGACEEEALLPYQPFVTALHPWVDAPESVAEAVLGDGAADLVPLMPELARRLPAGADAGVGPEARRYLMFQAAVALLRRVSRQAPVLLVIDDLHWADTATLALLRHVLDAATGARALVLGTYRDADPPPGPGLLRVLADLRREHVWDGIRLDGLGAEGVGELVSKLAPAAPADLAADLHAATGGNPFLVHELARDLGPGSASARLPEGVRAIVAGRVARLSAPCGRLLGAAAVAGPDADAALLGAVAELSGQPLLDALDEAVAACLLAELPGDEPAYRFCHALARQVVHDDLPAARRADLHRRLAEALSARPDRERWLGVVAHHLRAAGSAHADPAFEYTMAAADQAVGRLAFEQAIGLCQQALDLVGPDDERRTLVLRRRALAFQALTHAIMDGGQSGGRSRGSRSPTIS